MFFLFPLPVAGEFIALYFLVAIYRYASHNVKQKIRFPPFFSESQIKAIFRHFPFFLSRHPPGF